MPNTGKTKDRYNEVVEKIEQETKKTGSKVFVTIQDREASLLQSRIAEEAAAGAALPAGGLEAQFGEGARVATSGAGSRACSTTSTRSEWHRDHAAGRRHGGDLRRQGRVAVVGDWGTNLYGAPVSALDQEGRRLRAAAASRRHLLFGHEDRGASSASSTSGRRDAGKVSRALNGNHEMYSGGFAYFDDILPTVPPTVELLRDAERQLAAGRTRHRAHRPRPRRQAGRLARDRSCRRPGRAR